MIEQNDIRPIHSSEQYYNHGIKLLADENIYLDNFKEWIEENDSLLKNLFIELLKSNNSLDEPYLSWCMQQYIYYDYNQIVKEIGKLTEE